MVRDDPPGPPHRLRMPAHTPGREDRVGGRARPVPPRDHAGDEGDRRGRAYPQHSSQVVQRAPRQSDGCHGPVHPPLAHGGHEVGQTLSVLGRTVRLHEQGAHEGLDVAVRRPEFGQLEVLKAHGLATGSRAFVGLHLPASVCPATGREWPLSVPAVGRIPSVRPSARAGMAAPQAECRPLATGMSARDAGLRASRADKRVQPRLLRDPGVAAQSDPVSPTPWPRRAAGCGGASARDEPAPCPGPPRQGRLLRRGPWRGARRHPTSTARTPCRSPRPVRHPPALTSTHRRQTCRSRGRRGR
ncbi:MAG: hypothetical protein K0R30_2186 [Ornithinibacter sp.]|nr:hypothetical protein [Ornithinibacter sp.]